MKIIYCRKQAQKALEWANVNNQSLTKPLNLREVCENVKAAFLDESKSLFNGLVYSFVWKNDDEVICHITVFPHYAQTDQDIALFEVEVTEEEILEVMEAETGGSYEGVEEQLELSFEQPKKVNH